MDCPWCKRAVLMPPEGERDDEHECPTCHGTYVLACTSAQANVYELVGSVSPEYVPPPPETFEPTRAHISSGYEPGIPTRWIEITHKDGTKVLVRYER
jgi:hypothetical protein